MNPLKEAFEAIEPIAFELVGKLRIRVMNAFGKTSPPSRTLNLHSSRVDSQLRRIGDSVALMFRAHAGACPTAGKICEKSRICPMTLNHRCDNEDPHSLGPAKLRLCARSAYYNRGKRGKGPSWWNSRPCYWCKEPYLMMWSNVPCFYTVIWSRTSTAFAISENRVVTAKHVLNGLPREQDKVEKFMKDVRVVFGLTKGRLERLLEQSNGSIDIDNVASDTDVTVMRYKMGSRVEYSPETGGDQDWVKFDVEFVSGRERSVQPIENCLSNWKPESAEKKYEVAMLGHPLGLPVVLSQNKCTLTNGSGKNEGQLVAPLDSINGYSGAPVLVNIAEDWHLLGMCVGTSEKAKDQGILRDTCALIDDKGVNLSGEGRCAIAPYDVFRESPFKKRRAA